MTFSLKIRQDALVRSHRRCCVCHEFAGRNINVHHIAPEAAGGTNGLGNAIVLCFRCHADAGHYNPKHPLGTRYAPKELRDHRDQWWDHCEKLPAEPLGCGLDVGYVINPASTGDLHTYWLTASFTNDLPAKQDGWTLELFFPLQIPIQCADSDYVVEQEPVTIDQNRFRKVAIASRETIYRMQAMQIVDRLRHQLSYKMNHTASTASGSDLALAVTVGPLPQRF